MNQPLQKFGENRYTNFIQTKPDIPHERRSDRKFSGFISWFSLPWSKPLTPHNVTLQHVMQTSLHWFYRNQIEKVTCICLDLTINIYTFFYYNDTSATEARGYKLLKNSFVLETGSASAYRDVRGHIQVTLTLMTSHISVHEEKMLQSRMQWNLPSIRALFFFSIKSPPLFLILRVVVVLLLRLLLHLVDIFVVFSTTQNTTYSNEGTL